MASVIGPNRYLPGNTIPCEKGFECDIENCGLPAVRAVVGETDSFGSEINHFCEAHYQQHVSAQQEEDFSLTCEHCGVANNVRYVRDPDEGMYGPVYQLCQTCTRRMLASYEVDPDE